MSKYTTEVRFICESKSGLDVSGGFSDVNDIIANAWDKIFTTKTPFFDEAYRAVICQKILKHYYLREICCETVGIWLLWMNTRLEEIMPYYNQLYESAKIEFNPMQDVDLKKNHNISIKGTNTEDETRTDNSNETRNDTTENKIVSRGSNDETRNDTTENKIVSRGSNDETRNDTTENKVTLNGSNDETRNETMENKRVSRGNNDKTTTINGTHTSIGNSDETKKDLYSDTPQGAITGLENENYLTNARKITGVINNSTNEQNNTTEKTGSDYSDSETTTGNTNGATNIKINNTETSNGTVSSTKNNTTVNSETSNGTVNGTKNITTDNAETSNGTKIGRTNIEANGRKTNTGNSTTSEDYFESITGKQGTESYSTLLNKYRETFINIDMKVIDEFSDLFFGLW